MGFRFRFIRADKKFSNRFCRINSYAVLRRFGNSGRLKRVDDKRAAIEAERDGMLQIEQQIQQPADFIDIAPAPMVEPLAVEAPARASAQVAPPRRRGFASDEELAAWALENPGELSPSQISVLQRCLSRPIARENLRANGIDTEALRTLLRAAAA